MFIFMHNIEVAIIKAGIAHKIIHSSTAGIPLGATAHYDKFKLIFLDIALAQTVLGLETTSWLLEPELNLINKGASTEAFIGQELLAYSPYDAKAQLYYWHREARNSSAEIDYLIQKENQIIPVEVKSGAAGTLKSIKFFRENHRDSNYGIRFSSLNYAVDDFVQNFPLYAVAKVMNSKQEYLRALID